MRVEAKVIPLAGPEGGMPRAAAETMPMPGGRGAADKVEKHGWTVCDEPGEFHMVHKSLLQVDHAYQRDRVSKGRVLNIAREWSWVACGTLTVFDRGRAGYWVDDGQHRKLAADNRSDITLLPCMVFRAEDVRAEARGFVLTNTNRSNPNALQRFKADCLAQEPTALAVLQMVSASGYSVAGGRTMRSVGCVASLRDAFAANPEVARLAWQLCVEIADGDYIDERLFGALFYLESRLRRDFQGEQSLADPHNREGLVRYGQAKLLRATNDAMVGFGKGGARIWAEGVVNTLNKRRTSRRLPSMQTPPRRKAKGSEE